MGCVNIINISDAIGAIGRALRNGSDWKDILNGVADDSAKLLEEKIQDFINNIQANLKINSIQEYLSQSTENEISFNKIWKPFADGLLVEFTDKKENVSTNKYAEIDKTVNDIKLEFGSSDTSGYDRVLTRFKNNIASSAIFKVETNGRNIEKISSALLGSTEQKNKTLNENIFNFKKQLLNDISSLTHVDTNINFESTNDSIFTQIIINALTSFEQAINSSEKIDTSTEVYRKAHDAYVLLKYFDVFMDSVKFIEPKASYKNSAGYGTQMYTYVGMTSNPQTHFGKNELQDATKVNSPLLSMVFDNMPEVIKVGDEYQLKSDPDKGQVMVGSQAFMNIMWNFKRWVYSQEGGAIALSDMHIETLKSLLNEFVQKNMDSSDPEFLRYRIRYPDKLYAIEAVLTSNIDQNILENIWKYVDTNIGMSYLMYTDENGKIVLKEGRQNLINLQEIKILDRIKNAVYEFGTLNKDAFDKLCEDYDISFEDNIVYFGKFKDDKKTPEEGTFRLILVGDTSHGVQTNIEYWIAGDWRSSSTPTITMEDGTKITYTPFMGEESQDPYEKLNTTIKPVIETLLGMVPDAWQQYTNSKHLLDLFSHALCTTLLAISGNSSDFTFDTIGDAKIKVLNVYTNAFRNKLQNLSEMFAAAYGIDTAVTLKNLNGDSIPAFSLTSWIHNFKRTVSKLEQKADKKAVENIFISNFAYVNSLKIGEPFCRRDLQIGDTNRQSSAYTENEVAYLGVVCDFFQSLYDNKRNHILFQNTTNADKQTHWVIPYGKDIELGKINGEIVTLETALKNIISGNNANDNITLLRNKIYNCRRTQYLALATNLINDYNKVFDFSLETDPEYILDSINEIKNFIKNYESSDFYLENHLTIQEAFKTAGVEFINEVHLTKNGGFNPSLDDELQLYCGKDSSKFWQRNNKQLDYFIEDLLSTGFELNFFDDNNTAEILEKFPEKERNKWIDFNTGNVLFKIVDSKGNIEYNPLLWAYFLCDDLCSTEFNKIATGFIWAHDGKYKPSKDAGDFNSDGSLNDNYFVHDAAKRLAASYKRTVINGASIERFVPKDFGIGGEFNFILVKDIPGIVWNMMGEQKDDLDSMDGSSLVNPIFAVLEGKSSPDGKIMYDSKTIGGDIDPKFGIPSLLKHAEFGLTNHRRQMGYMSEASVEHAYEMMNSKPLYKYIPLEKYYGYKINGTDSTEYNKDDYTVLYKKDPITGKTYLIHNLSTREIIKFDGDHSYSATECTYYLTEVDSNGKYVMEEDPSDGRLKRKPSSKETVEINTLYDIDQILGGAWCMKLGENGLEDYDGNITTLAYLVCQEQIKDKIIAYIINSSAFKVGTRNINGSNVFNHDFARTLDGKLDMSQVLTTTMSTENLGRQVNPDHELEFSEVSEMSQMISALIQGGHFTSLVNNIYREIGKVAAEAMRLTQDALDKNDPDLIYRLLGESLMEAFETGNRSTTGLAQSFLIKAKKCLNDNNIKYEIPFSGPTINAAFISDVVSTINRKGIRRKYAGVASVLVPSHNMIQYYSLDGQNRLMFSEFAQQVDERYPRIKEDGETIHQSIIKNREHVYKLINDKQYAFDNGAITPLTDGQRPDIEDTILIGTVNTDGSINLGDPIKIDSWDNFDYIRNLQGPNVILYKWNTKPRNLRQADVTFRIGNRTFSMYDLDSVRALHYLNLYRDNKHKRNSGIHALSQDKDGNIIGLNKEAKIEVIQKALLKAGIVWDGRTFPNKLDSWLTALDALMRADLASLDEGIIDNQVAFGIETDQKLQVEDLTSRHAEMIMGRLHAAELGLRPGDNINTIKQLGQKFFEDRIKEHRKVNSAKGGKVYDYIVTTGTGHVMYVAVKPNHEKNALNPYTVENKNFSTEDTGIWFNHSEKISDFNGDCKIVSIQNDNKEVCPLVIFNSTEDALKFINSEGIDFIDYNVTVQNFKDIVRTEFIRELSDGKTLELRRATRLKPGIVLSQDIINNFDNLSNTEKKDLVLEVKKYLDSKNEYRLQKLAHKQWLAFQAQLLYVGARIPTQSMQSFQALECVGFSDSMKNEVYVPKSQTWLQGSDYDIDKLYIMSFNLCKNGILPTFSALENEENLTSLLPLLSLEAPNGIEYEKLPFNNIQDLADGEDYHLFNNIVLTKSSTEGVVSSYVLRFADNPELSIELSNNIDGQNEVFTLTRCDNISKKDAVALLKAFIEISPEGTVLVSDGSTNSDNILSGLLRGNHCILQDGLIIKNPNGFEHEYCIHVGGADLLNAVNMKDFRIFNKIMNSKSQYVMFDEGVELSSKEFLRLLNKHTTNTKVPYKERALQNSVLGGILELLNKRTIQPYGHNPITTDDLKALVKQDPVEMRMNMDNPFTKFMMQVQNMVGKEVIGITAVSMKVFFAASTYFNSEIDAAIKAYKDCDDEEFTKHLLNILFVDSSGKIPELNTMANLNLKGLEALLSEKDDIEISLPITLNVEISRSLRNILDNYCIKRNVLSLKTLLYGNQRVKGIIEKSQTQDAAQNISQLLSAATDNAKELILAKINATSEFADIWGAMLMTGHSFKETNDVMQSPFFNYIAKMSKSFGMSKLHKGVSSKNIINFMALEGNIPSINAKALRFALGAYPSSGLNKCFAYKMFYETDDQGRLLTMKNGKKEAIDGTATYKDLIPRKNPLYFYKPDNSGKLQKIFINEEYLRKVGAISDSKENSSIKVDALQDDIKYWLTSSEIVNIFEKHLRSLLPKYANYKAFSQSKWRRKSSYNDEDDFDSYEDFESEIEQDDWYGLDEEEEDGYTKEPLVEGSIEDYRMLLRYTQKFLKSRAEVLEKNWEKFGQFKTIVNDVLPITEEQNIAGMELGVNQGIPTNEFDFYNKLLRIENFINSAYSAAGLETNFDIVQFIENPSYKEFQINKYESIKYALNPLAIISRVPNFAQMFDFYGTANKLLGRSAQFQLDFIVAKQVLKQNNTRRLNAAEFKVMHNTIKDSLILSWLKSERLKINIPSNQLLYLPVEHGDIRTYYSPNLDSSMKNIEMDLGTIEGLATFKHLMDVYVFPKLKQAFPDNLFIRTIDSRIQVNKLHNQVAIRKRMPINMMTLDDSPVSKDMFNSIMQSFGEIAKNTDFLKKLGISDELSIGDAIYLYNLYVYKDSFSQDSFTRVFEVMNVYNDDALINKYYKYLSEIDRAMSISSPEQSDGHYEVTAEDGSKFTFDVLLKDVLYRMSILPNAATRLGIMPVINNGIKQIETTDSYGNPTGERFDVRCKDASDFWMELPFSTGSGLNAEALQNLGLTKEDIQQRFIPNEAQVIYATMDAIDDTCNLNGDNVIEINNDTIKAWSQNPSNAPIDLSDQEILKRISRARGFIYDGKIYINTSMSNFNGNTKIHELAHAVCAMLKYSRNEDDRNFYYGAIKNAFSKFSEKELWRKAELMGFKSIHNPDFMEELFVEEVSEAFKNGLNNTVFKDGEKMSLNNLQDKIRNAVNRMLGTNVSERIPLQKLGDTDLTIFMAMFGSIGRAYDNNSLTSTLIHSTEAKAFKQHLIKNSESEFNNSSEGIFYTCD